jgi:neuropeptide Y receptor type 5
MVTNYLRGFQNKTVDFKRPYLKPSVLNIYPLFITIYATLSVCGGLANLAMISIILKRNLQKTDPKFCFLINLALSHIVMCVFVLPLSLTVMLIQNWIFGAGMCYCLPMIQVYIHIILLYIYMITVYNCLYVYMIQVS